MTPGPVLHDGPVDEDPVARFDKLVFQLRHSSEFPKDRRKGLTAPWAASHNQSLLYSSARPLESVAVDSDFQVQFDSTLSLSFMQSKWFPRLLAGVWNAVVDRDHINDSKVVV